MGRPGLQKYTRRLLDVTVVGAIPRHRPASQLLLSFLNHAPRLVPGLRQAPAKAIRRRRAAILPKLAVGDIVNAGHHVSR
jgi:hypothetical protein